MGGPLIDTLIKAGLAAEVAGSFAGGLSAKAGVDFGQSFNQQTQAEATFEVSGNALKTTKAAAGKIGDLLAEEKDSESGKQVLAVQTRAGWFNANPAIVVAIVGEGKVSALAFAKEGLIDQKTAVGAIARFGDALIALGSGEDNAS